jgi:hypothetical protein
MEDSEEKDGKPAVQGEAPKGPETESASRRFTIAMVILGAVTTCIAGGLITVAVTEHYKPDVRYEEGTWYYSGLSGIVPLRIKNYGAAKAEKIIFTVSFDGIIDHTFINDPTVECQFAAVATGPQGSKTTTGTIERLVPRQTTVVYFDIKRQSVDTVLKEGSFVVKMVHSGGIGRVGEPLLPKLFPITFPWVVSLILVILLSEGYWWFRNRSQEAQIAEREMRCRWIEDRYKRTEEETRALKKSWKKEEERISRRLDEANKLVDELEKRRVAAKQEGDAQNG